MTDLRCNAFPIGGTEYPVTVAAECQRASSDDRRVAPEGYTAIQYCSYRAAEKDHVAIMLRRQKVKDVARSGQLLRNQAT